MKHAKKLTALSLSLLLLFSANLYACETAEEDTATYIELSDESVEIAVGESYTLKADTDGKKVVFTSDATHIAKVDEDGVITAVSEGEATIKARSGDKRAYCEVKVVPEKEQPVDPVSYATFKEAYQNYFPIGAAVQTNMLVNGQYGELTGQYSSLTSENGMKWKNIEATKGVYTFNREQDSADELVTWAKNNGVGVRGHCLLWYKSLPKWLHDEFVGKSFSAANKTAAINYIEERIEKMMTHYGSDIYAWDVVNEALFNSISSDKLVTSSEKPYGNIFRTNDNMSETSTDWVDWYKVTGGYEYIAKAFKKAGEVREKYNIKTELYYNDYSLNTPNKRQACLNLIKMLKDNNAPIDGVGMQAHYRLEDYLENKNTWLKNFEDSVKAFIAAGVDVQLTELDIRYEGEDSDTKELQQADMYGEIMKICRKYAKKDNAHGVTGVTFWGVYDGANGAWGSKYKPMPFDENRNPKKAFYAMTTF